MLYLNAEIRLLESRAAHGLGTRALASGPDALSVGSLGDLDGARLLDFDGGLFGRRLQGRGGLELPSGSGEGALRHAHAARKGTNCPHLRGSHRDCVGYRVWESIGRCRAREQCRSVVRQLKLVDV